MIGASLGGEFIELAYFCIRFNLLVPQISMKFREPVGQGDNVVMGQGSDCLFDLFKFGHRQIISQNGWKSTASCLSLIGIDVFGEFEFEVGAGGFGAAQGQGGAAEFGYGGGAVGQAGQDFGRDRFADGDFH